MSKQKKIIRVLLILLVIAALGGWYAYSEYNRPLANMADAKSEVSSKAIDLITDFEKDETAASKKFVDKVIEVEGTLKEATADDQGLYTLALGDEASMSSVRCSVDSAFTVVASQLNKGEIVKIKGVCSGFTIDELLGSDVTLVRCAVIK
jgi:hypothetical protein